MLRSKDTDKLGLAFLLWTVLVILILTGCASTTSPVVMECPKPPPAPPVLTRVPAALVPLKPSPDGSVTYATALRTVTKNYAICQETAATVVSWQEFYEGVRRLHAP